MYSLNDTTTLLVVSSLIRISTDRGLFAAPRSFSQLVTSFFGAMYQGILLYALCSLILIWITFVIPSNCFTNSLRLSRLIFFLRDFFLRSSQIRINLRFLISFLVSICFSLPSVLILIKVSLLSLSSLLFLLCSCQSTSIDISRYWWEQVDSNYQHNCLCGYHFFPKC